MKTFVTLVLLLGISFFSNAQAPGPRKVKGNGNVIEKERRLPEFTKIEISGNIDVTLLNNDYQKKIIVNGDMNLQPLIKSKIENGTLYLTYDNNIVILSQTVPLKVRIPSKVINEIVLKNGAKLSNLGVVEGGKISITAFDNSTADLNMKADEMIVTVSDNAQIKFSGSANTVKLNHKGNKDIDAKEMSNFYTEIILDGSGDIYSNTVNGIDGDINGTGNLYYRATKTINVNENSTGKAIQL